MPDGTLPQAQPRLLSEVWPEFLAQIPGVLASQDPATGRFGTQPFIVNDQNALWPLAVAWSTEPGAMENPFFHSPEVLAAIVAGGDALIAVSDEAGMFEFRKKDHSTWGQIYMPWTYSRWIRAWGLVRDAMPVDRRAAWDAALTKAVDGIVATVLTGKIHNIPAHHAMGVYRASQVLGRADWEAVAVDYLRRTADDQDPAGFWSEHFGPVVRYNFVYIDVLGSYYAMSGDSYVLPALERTAQFHANFTYPDGTTVETIDERNVYRHTSASSSVGFTASPVGRGYLSWLGRLGLAHVLGLTSGPTERADALASIVAYGQDGPYEPAVAERDQHRFVLGADDAMVERQTPWFVTLSAYHCPQPSGRWIQDRQAHLSVFHDQVGLIMSGSNTRAQPKWSTFTVGDTSLLAHLPGDEDPAFDSVPGLVHLPSTVTLRPDDLAVDLDYGGVDCVARIELPDQPGVDAVVHYDLASRSEIPVEAHAGFVPGLGEAWQAGPHNGVIGEETFRLTGAECEGTFAHRGWRITVPDDAIIEWPVRPHNPYSKDGSAPPDESRILVTLPLGTEPTSAELIIAID